MSDGWGGADAAAQLESGEIDLNELAGKLEDEDSLLLWNYIADVLEKSDDLPDIENTPLAERYDALQAVTLQKGIRNGNDFVLKRFTGANNRTQATGYERLIRKVKRAAEQILIKGAKGSGKTTKAFDIARKLMADIPSLIVVTNVPGPHERLDNVIFSESLAEWLWIANQPGEKLFIGDEFSTVINAYGGKGYDVETTFGRVINALRKCDNGSNRLLCIGHQNDSDIHPLIREQSETVLHAEGASDSQIHKATVYDGWGDFKTDNPEFRLYGMQDVTGKWEVDGGYFAHFALDLDEPQKQIQRGRLIDDWEEYQDEPHPRSLCLSDGCLQFTENPSGYCNYHKEQDEIDDNYNVLDPEVDYAELFSWLEDEDPTVDLEALFSWLFDEEEDDKPSEPETPAEELQKMLYDLKKRGMSYQKIADEVGLAKSSVYNKIEAWSEREE